MVHLSESLSCIDCRSVMEDHTDDSRYVLTQGKNSSEDWVARGQNFMDSRLHDLAAHCYKVAQDPVRFTVATAYASVMAVKSKQAALTQAQIRQEHFRVKSCSLTCPLIAMQCPCRQNT